MFRSTEGSLAADDSVMAKRWPEPGEEGLGLGEKMEVTMEAERVLGEGAL